MAPRFVYGRRVKGPGSPPAKHHRSSFAYEPGTETYSVVDGVVGKPTNAQYARKPYVNSKLRMRRLPCGHGVFMVKGQFPDEDTFCTQCRDGRPIR